MENTEQNGYNNPRMDRIERTLEKLAADNVADHEAFNEEHKKLLTAQVLLTDAQRTTDEQMKATDARIGILVGMMDTFIRERGNAR